MSLYSKIKLLMKVNDMVSGIVKFLEGKKTWLGMISLVLWAMIYAIPVIHPQWAFVADWARNIQHLLASIGLPLDDGLLTGGMGLTIIGLLDKVRRLLGGA
jgi:hypothetical protein